VSTDPTRRAWVEQVMGLPVSVLARGADADAAWTDRVVALFLAELHEVDAAFSPYRPDSEVSRLARGELGLPDASVEVREVAARCERARQWTGGLFDATRPDRTWDPSGLVKGWAVERAARHLCGPDAQSAGLDWCVNAGGDVLVLAPSGKSFVIGIQDPVDPRAVAATVETTGAAVATSGTAARGAHLYDPRTQVAVATSLLSVTVTGPSLETADVLATAAYVAADAWAETVAGVDGYEGLAIAADRSMTRTRGWALPAQAG
jgi:thiamine biosynthesis lipoprotein